MIKSFFYLDSERAWLLAVSSSVHKSGGENGASTKMTACLKRCLKFYESRKAAVNNATPALAPGLYEDHRFYGIEDKIDSMR